VYAANNNVMNSTIADESDNDDCIMIRHKDKRVYLLLLGKASILVFCCCCNQTITKPMAYNSNYRLSYRNVRKLPTILMLELSVSEKELLQ